MSLRLARSIFQTSIFIFQNSNISIVSGKEYAGRIRLEIDQWNHMNPIQWKIRSIFQLLLFLHCQKIANFIFQHQVSKQEKYFSYSHLVHSSFDVFVLKSVSNNRFLMGPNLWQINLILIIYILGQTNKIFLRF